MSSFRHLHNPLTTKPEVLEMTLTKYLMQENIVKVMSRSVPAFVEPLEKGMKQIVQGWLTNYLAKGCGDSEDEEVQNYEEIDPDYNIHDTTII